MASNFTIDTSALRRLDMSFIKAGKDFKKGRKKFLQKIGVLIQGMARKYCPESPTLKQYAAMNQDYVTMRDATSITTGSLRDSITVESKDDYVSIHVPANSRGGKYAEKMHDEKGVTWQNRGVRTQQKGPKADEKFIFRAGKDTDREQDAIVDDLINKFINSIGV